MTFNELYLALPQGNKVLQPFDLQGITPLEIHMVLAFPDLMHGKGLVLPQKLSGKNTIGTPQMQAHWLPSSKGKKFCSETPYRSPWTFIACRPSFL